MWRESYEDDNFVENVDKMWSQVEPLYKELHTYVRRKLQKIYDKDMDKDSDLIPAHLLGNMWVSSTCQSLIECATYVSLITGSKLGKSL